MHQGHRSVGGRVRSNLLLSPFVVCRMRLHTDNLYYPLKRSNIRWRTEYHRSKTHCPQYSCEKRPLSSAQLGPSNKNIMFRSRFAPVCSRGNHLLQSRTGSKLFLQLLRLHQPRLRAIMQGVSNLSCPRECATLHHTDSFSLHMYGHDFESKGTFQMSPMQRGRRHELFSATVRCHKACKHPVQM